MNADKIPVSVVIISKNEELAIVRCVESVQRYDEVFVVDSHSSDRTAELAANAGGTVVPFTWNGQYPKKKQWALENLPLRNDWVLFLDGDEYSTEEFDREVRVLVARPSADAYDVGLDYVFLGKLLRYGHKVYKRVLFDRRKAGWEPLDDLSVDEPMEMELHVQPTVRGRIGRTTARIVHDDLEPLEHYFDRHNRYSAWEAVLRTNFERRTERTRQGKLWERIPGKPALFVIYALLVRQGWRDGYEGRQYAFAHAFYFWQISLKTRELERRQQC
jgi:glycosyltransferase involved in cell wall biosynthesis